MRRAHAPTATTWPAPSRSLPAPSAAKASTGIPLHPQSAEIARELTLCLVELGCCEEALPVSQVAAGQGKTRREVVDLTFKRRPVGATIATISLALLVVTPVAFAVLRYFVPASSWWTAVGVPILVMPCGWVGAAIARSMVFGRER